MCSLCSHIPRGETTTPAAIHLVTKWDAAVRGWMEARDRPPQVLLSGQSPELTRVGGIGIQLVVIWSDCSTAARRNGSRDGTGRAGTNKDETGWTKVMRNPISQALRVHQFMI
jgi:hypothetical protein